MRGAVISVTGKAVDFPADHGVKYALFAVFHHPLEFVSFIGGFAGHSFIRVCLHNRNAVAVRKVGTFADLSFN